MRRNLYLLLAIAITLSCKKPYNPPGINVASGYLVVEGTVNSGTDSTFIKLSRTVNLQTQISVKPELNAIVVIEGDQHVSYPLTDIGNGRYTCAGLNLDNNHNYRLNIKTANNEQYLSDYTAVLNSPPIDSISYDVNGTVYSPGLNVYANTHDPAGKVVYYRWDYQETWEVQSEYYSKYKSNGDTVLQRDLVHDDVHTCWLADTSTTIIIGSSAKLSKPVISNSPIVAIRSDDEKIGTEYSIIVKQYALTADAYNFYTNLKKNTEQLGSIFDAQPSEIGSNIHCVTTPSQPVVGYVSIGNTVSKRIFVKKGQLPVPWRAEPYYSNCSYFVDIHNKKPCCYYDQELYPGYSINQVNTYINYNSPAFANSVISSAVMPVDSIKLPSDRIIGDILGYTAAIPECVDCTLRASNKRPLFWK